MTLRPLGLVAFLAALAPAASFAQGSDEAACVLDEYQVTEVRPYVEHARMGRSAVQHLRGAEIVVHTRPGLTAEWLRHEISEHRASMQPMSDCVFDLEDVRVQVRPAGMGYVVRVTAPDDAGGREVLERARHLGA